MQSSGVVSHRIERELADVGGALARAKAECVKFRSEWSGDERGGRYRLRTPLGSIVGSYAVVEQRVSFLVEKKPRLVPYILIERVLDEFLKS